MRMRRLHGDEKGVAMVTVLLIGAALTALTSAAAFVTIEEMGATRADRNAAQALAYAEAGIDRLVLEIRKGNLTWNNISTAGCDAEHPVITYSGPIGTGTYTTTLEVYNRTGAVSDPAHRFRPTACSTASLFPQGTHEYLITSTGQQPTARRVVRQTLDIKPLGLPLGIYAYDRIDANGTVNMQNINMITEGVVYNRDNLGFFGTDPYYTLGDFYGSTRITDAAIRAYKMPASVHAKGAIYYGAASKSSEHRSGFEPNCEANDAKGTLDQSLWDTSGTAVLLTLSGGCPSWPGSGQDYPPGTPFTTPNSVTPPLSCTSANVPCLKFTEEDRKRVAPSPTLTEQDYLTLREAAKQNGLYCTGSGALAANLSCTEANRTESANPYSLVGGQLGLTDINNITEKSFVIYIEFANDGFDPFVRDVKWSGTTDIGPCNTNPATNQSAVIVVRRGSFSAAGGSKINGAMLIPEGTLYTGGGFTMEGTVIARRIESRGTSTLRLSTCWLRNLPGPFLDTTRVTWSEVDR